MATKTGTSNNPEVRVPELPPSDSSKRSKQMPITTCTIVELSLPTHPYVFEGNVVALYGPSCNKNSSSPNKAELTRADLVDRDGQLTVIVNMNNTLVSLFMKYFSPESSLRISNFITRNKGIYDRADAKHCIVLHQQTAVETIPQVCQQRKLAPDTTIHALSMSTNAFSVGSDVALVITCEQDNKNYELCVKDGEKIQDTAKLQLPGSYRNLFFKIQQ